jgi:hypothetical protein
VTTAGKPLQTQSPLLDWVHRLRRSFPTSENLFVSPPCRHHSVGSDVVVTGGCGVGGGVAANVSICGWPVPRSIGWDRNGPDPRRSPHRQGCRLPAGSAGRGAARATGVVGNDSPRGRLTSQPLIIPISDRPVRCRDCVCIFAVCSLYWRNPLPPSQDAKCRQTNCNTAYAPYTSMWK